MRQINSVTVYCGSNPGFDPIYKEEITKLGHYIADQGIRLVYGGSRLGLMGVLADSVLERGGKVRGIMPSFLRDKEQFHPKVTDMLYTPDQNIRKQKMAEEGDGIIAFPGGFGTIEEMLEVIAWGQVGVHDKPCGFLNIKGFYDPLMSFFHDICNEGFAKADHLQNIILTDSPKTMITRFRNYQPARVNKWFEDNNQK